MYEHFVAHSVSHASGAVLEAAGRGTTQLLNKVYPYEIPSAEKLIDMYIHGWVDAGTTMNMLKATGVNANLGDWYAYQPDGSVDYDYKWVWNRFAQSQSEVPTITDIFTLRNRGIFTNSQEVTFMQHLGFTDLELLQKMRILKFDVPGPSDLVRFAVRHVFEPDLISQLGYDDEYRPVLDIFHNWQGLNYKIISGPMAEGISELPTDLQIAAEEVRSGYEEFGLEEPTWARAYWWSHWVLPSPTQGYEMLYRLRPDRDRRFDHPEFRELNFTLRELRLLLRANDYPPFWRDKLAAISGRIPGQRFLRGFAETGALEREGLAELLLRQGYSPEYTRALVQLVEKQTRDKRRKEIESKARLNIGKAWELGTIDDDEYRALLEEHGMRPEDADDVVRTAAIERARNRAAKTLTVVHRRFVTGAIDRAGAQNLLLQIGINPLRVEDYLHDWGLEITEERRQVNAQKAVKWACDGFISILNMRVRLANLHYDQEDIEGFTAEATACFNQRIARALAAAERARRQTLRDQQQAIRRLQQALRQQQLALSRHGTPSQLAKWYWKALIPRGEVFARLRFLGWPDADTARLLASERPKGCNVPVPPCPPAEQRRGQGG